MDTQLKKGLLEVCVLRAIEIEESYGYQILSKVTKYIEISESTLYPILKRLELMEAVVVRHEEFSGRLRKYYSITSVGEKKLEDFNSQQILLKKVYKFIEIGEQI